MFYYDGVSINYKIVGKGKDYLLFLHGWGCNIDSFNILLNYFSKYYRCIIFDFPAHGKSTEPLKPVNLSFFVESTYVLLKQLNIKKISIISHSFGGRVAICLADKYNQVIDKLILIDSAGVKPRRNLLYVYNVCKYKFLKNT